MRLDSIAPVRELNTLASPACYHHHITNNEPSPPWQSLNTFMHLRQQYHISRTQNFLSFHFLPLFYHEGVHFLKTLLAISSPSRMQSAIIGSGLLQDSLPLLSPQEPSPSLIGHVSRGFVGSAPFLPSSRSACQWLRSDAGSLEDNPSPLCKFAACLFPSPLFVASNHSITSRCLSAL